MIPSLYSYLFTSNLGWLSMRSEHFQSCKAKFPSNYNARKETSPLKHGIKNITDHPERNLYLA